MGWGIIPSECCHHQMSDPLAWPLGPSDSDTECHTLAQTLGWLVAGVKQQTSDAEQLCCDLSLSVKMIKIQ